MHSSTLSATNPNPWVSESFHHGTASPAATLSSLELRPSAESVLYPKAALTATTSDYERTKDFDSSPRFACPFYKHDSYRYRNRRVCPGPGWPTVHRMKEHLYRSHARSIFCNRCNLTFDSDDDLSRHQLADSCLLSTPQSTDGISRETLKILRKRSPAFRPEKYKWKDTYRLLFPNVSPADIPSPCTCICSLRFYYLI
jgi:hypothetical protein